MFPLATPCFLLPASAKFAPHPTIQLAFSITYSCNLIAAAPCSRGAESAKLELSLLRSQSHSRVRYSPVVRRSLTPIPYRGPTRPDSCIGTAHRFRPKARHACPEPVSGFHVVSNSARLPRRPCSRESHSRVRPFASPSNLKPQIPAAGRSQPIAQPFLTRWPNPVALTRAERAGFISVSFLSCAGRQDESAP